MAVGVWDTAGSERYEAMSRMYYRNAKAAIVCYAVNDFDSWDKECRPTLTLLEFRRYMFYPDEYLYQGQCFGSIFIESGSSK